MITKKVYTLVPNLLLYLISPDKSSFIHWRRLGCGLLVVKTVFLSPGRRLMTIRSALHLGEESNCGNNRPYSPIGLWTGPCYLVLNVV